MLKRECLTYFIWFLKLPIECMKLYTSINWSTLWYVEVHIQSDCLIRAHSRIEDTNSQIKQSICILIFIKAGFSKLNWKFHSKISFEIWTPILYPQQKHNFKFKHSNAIVYGSWQSAHRTWNTRRKKTPVLMKELLRFYFSDMSASKKILTAIHAKSRKGHESILNMQPIY